MDRIKIGVFAYNFKHWKTQMGLTNLSVHGFKPEVIFAMDKIKLNVPMSERRIMPKDLFLTEPSLLAKKYDISYHVVIHNNCEKLIKSYDLDIGVILGARIIALLVINAFKYGIVNLHPGLLPENRGLDNIKWAVIKGMDNGVTVHFIDENIDRGNLITRGIIKLYPDDTLMDLYIRIQNLEQELMIATLKYFKENGIHMGEYPSLREGFYHGAVPVEHDVKIDIYLSEYLKKKCHGNNKVDKYYSFVGKKGTSNVNN